jgi:hypothetical protein
MGYGEADHVADCKALLRVDANRLVESRARGTNRADSARGKQALRLAGRASCHARRYLPGSAG